MSYKFCASSEIGSVTGFSLTRRNAIGLMWCRNMWRAHQLESTRPASQTAILSGPHDTRMTVLQAQTLSVRALASNPMEKAMHIEVTHPCVQHKLALIRDRATGHTAFRELAREITLFVCYEALKEVELEAVTVQTPVGEAACHTIATDLVVVPILRAGMGMLDGVLALAPTARVGFVGLYRDEQTHEPVEYYCKLPQQTGDALHIVVDPMLATGGSMNATLQLLKNQGARQIVVVCIVTCPEGLQAVEQAHPDVVVYAASVDSHLNDQKYIVPGLGDAGDRLFGTR